jgi:hypothetical protein
MKENSSPLTILFGGEMIRAKLVDGTEVDCFIRAMPIRAMGDVLARAEDQAGLVELCTYLHAAAGEDSPAGAPAGMCPVQRGWADNLTADSFFALHEAATRLNFTTAVTWATAQISAKKTVGPLFDATIRQISPMVDRIIQPLLARIKNLSDSAPNPLPPSDSAVKKS